MAVRRAIFSKSPTVPLKPTLSIWKEYIPERDDFNQTRIQTLNLTHPILQVLESSKPTLKLFNQIHTQLIILGMFQNSLVSSRVIKKLCSSPCLVSHAYTVFSVLDEPDAFLCNTIIRSYVNFNNPDIGLRFYHEEMFAKCISPNHYTFPLLVKICAEMGLIQEGEKTHSRILKFGFELDLFVRNSLIHMYSSFRKITDARKLFDASFDSDIVTWNSMIHGYVKNGEVSAARTLFDEMPEKDIVSWNSMIAGYTGVEDMKSAEEIFDRMPFRDVVSWNSMIDGYAKLGVVSAALNLFDRMSNRNVVTWNIILALHVRIKSYEECLRFFDGMVAEGTDVEPNEATLVSVLTAITNLGSLERGILVHSYIKENGRIKPDILLSTTILTMYSKCGAMELAREVFDKMEERNVVSWNSMIMGYGTHGDGEKALEMFLEMEKNGPMPNDATFVCVLSACTHSGMVLEGWRYFEVMQKAYKIEPKVEHYGCMIDLLGRAGLMKDSEKLIKMMPMEAGPALWGALLSSCHKHSNSELGELVGKKLIALEPYDVGAYVLLSNIYAIAGKWVDVEKVRKMMEEKGLHKHSGFSLINLASQVFL
ncbi:hypothetical protein MKW94_002592 [Papaver nudicaule]|uniref:Chlororespiratory reduction 4 n=1 Tax=Papaver nudicaule TaxID=74823 RepID=A0AA42B5Q2_PAPNU|nr:hypothetical protein [Papaver nudicaule]